jgi:hypothetical protein
MSALHNLEAGVPYLIVIVMVWGSPSQQHPRVTKKSRMHARKEYSTVFMKSIIDSQTITFAGVVGKGPLGMGGCGSCS